jgi:hypothetical protein
MAHNAPNPVHHQKTASLFEAFFSPKNGKFAG